MTTDSVWLVERVSGNCNSDLSQTFRSAQDANRYIKELLLTHGGTYRAVEYRRVKEGE